MTRDERLKKYQEAGAEFVEAARAKAEEIFHEVSSAGEATSGRATSTVDDLLGGGKRSTDQFFDAVRREISTQVRALGLATTADLDALERRLTGLAPAKKAAAAKSPAAKVTAKKAPAKKAPAKKAPAAKVTAKKAPARKATAAKVGAPTATSGTTAKKVATKTTGTTRKATKRATPGTR